MKTAAEWAAECFGFRETTGEDYVCSRSWIVKMFEKAMDQARAEGRRDARHQAAELVTRAFSDDGLHKLGAVGAALATEIMNLPLRSK